MQTHGVLEWKSLVIAATERWGLAYFPFPRILRMQHWSPNFVSRSLHVAFVVEEYWSLGEFFSGIFPFFPAMNFITLISPSSFHPFHSPLCWYVKPGQPVPSLNTDHNDKGFISSHLSTWPESQIRDQGLTFTVFLTDYLFI